MNSNFQKSENNMPMISNETLYKNLHFMNSKSNSNKFNFDTYAHYLTNDHDSQLLHTLKIRNPYTEEKNSSPGRKSASPTFFHSSHFIARDSTEPNETFSNANDINKPSTYEPIQNYGQINIPSNQKTLQSLPQIKSPVSLKIPTTPTRSKSLSPSLRQVVQPPRIRHKQTDTNNSYSKIYKSNKNSFPIDNKSSNEKIKESREDKSQDKSTELREKLKSVKE